MGISQFEDIGGTELYYEYVGESNDGPTIVFESGYGWSLDKWHPISGEISKFARVCMYDREGVGKSGNSDRPKHSLQIIENLRNLLKKADIKPPYIMVGHSFGGLNVRLYAGKYPDDVKGIVLLDSVHEEQNQKMVPLLTKEFQQVYLGQFVVLWMNLRRVWNKYAGLLSKTFHSLS